MKIDSYSLYRFSIFYLVIPILFFFLGWLRFGIGLLLSALLLLATFSFFKKIKTLLYKDSPIILSQEHFKAFIILFLFLLCTGNTGFVGSWGFDIPWRNAIYQDLIHQPWPVIYDFSHSILCYYMVFWLVPAEIVHLLNLSEVGSNVVLFLWMYIGLLLVFFLLCNVLRIHNKFIVYAIILFLFFSGINTIGMLIKGIFIGPDPLIGDLPGRIGWSFAHQDILGMRAIYIIRSIYLCISDVYNQFFSIAISTFIFLKFKTKIEFYAFIGLLVLPYSPIGFIGVFTIILLHCIVVLCREQSLLLFCFRRSLSLTNILSILAIVPIFYLYYTMNMNAALVVADTGGINDGFLYVPLNQYNIFRIVTLIIYYFTHFGLYAILIYPYHKKNALYWCVIFCLLIFPFFRIGNGADFNFNATICPFIILFALILEELINNINNSQTIIRNIVLISMLAIAMLTPVIQISTSFRAAYLHGVSCYKQVVWDDNLKKDSLIDKKIEGFSNFLSDTYEKSLFFLFLAKRT